MSRRPIGPGRAPAGVRQRRRADGSWRVWWEPPAVARALGFRAEDLTPDTLGMRRAGELNRMADEAIAAKPAAPRRIAGDRTVDALIDAYRRDDHWRSGLSAATRADYDKAFRLIARDWGSTPVLAIGKAAVRAWRADVLEGRRDWQAAGRYAWQAKSLTAKLSLLLSFAEVLGWLPDGANPCLRLDGRRQRALRTPPRSRVASWAELGALLRGAAANGDRSMAVAIALAALAAQRQADVVKATLPEFARPGLWLLVRSKRQNFGALKLHPLADGAVRDWLARRPAIDGDALLVSERTGRPYSADLFRKVYGAARRTGAKAAPSVADLQFRDLRRTFGHLARLGGAATRDDVAAVLGNTAHVDPQLAVTYMPAADAVAARAVDAIVAPAGFWEGLDDE